MSVIGLPVVTVAAGGLPVVDVSGSLRGTPVTEAANGRGVAVTKVAARGLPVVYESIGVAAALAPTTFNPADFAGNTTLSGGNLVTTGGIGTAGVRSIASITAGKYYWEYTYTTINTNSLTVGVCLASFNLAAGLVTNAATVARLSGQIQVNGVSGGTALGQVGTGNIICLAIDKSAQLIWMRLGAAGNWNGSGTANPATGTGGLSTAALAGALFGFASTGGNGDKLTANFGASAFAGAVPSGFTAGLLV